MINIDEEKKKMRENCENQISFLDLLEPVKDHIRFVHDNNAYIQEESWNRCLEMLHEFKSVYGYYELDGYYMSSEHSIAVVYKFKKVGIVFLCTDVDYALESVGGGKCRIEECTKTEKTIICDI